MRIISPFKDYYDYIAHQYGGGDPRVTFERRPLGGVELISITVQGIVPTLPQRYATSTPREYGWCAVAGRYFLLYRTSGWALVVPGTPAYEELTARPRWLARHSPWYTAITGELRGPELVTLAREVGMPIFIITEVSRGGRNANTTQVKIDPVAPTLSKLGFASVIPPEQMYQDVAYFLGNTMHPSPDTAPPVAVSDSDKIVQHGFDPKQSFRHRK